MLGRSKNKKHRSFATKKGLSVKSCFHLSVSIVIPSSPRDVKVSFVNQSVVEITWQPPVVHGDQTHVSYEIDCRIQKICSIHDCLYEDCGNDIKHIPNTKDLEINHLTVAGLSPLTNYTFKIFAKNRVSQVAKRKHRVELNFAKLTIRTKGSGKSWDILVNEARFAIKLFFYLPSVSSALLCETRERYMVFKNPTLKESDHKRLFPNVLLARAVYRKNQVSKLTQPLCSVTEMKFNSAIYL